MSKRHDLRDNGDYAADYFIMKKLISTGDGLSVLRNNHAAIVHRPAHELQKLDAQNILQKCQAGKRG